MGSCPPGGSPSAPNPCQKACDDLRSRRGAHADLSCRELIVFDRLYLAGGFQNDIFADFLQAIGQVVVDRATAAAWGALRDEISGLLRCPGPSASAPPKDSQFPAVCKVLAGAQIQDLVSSPNTLLQATTADLLGVVDKRLNATGVDTRLVDALKVGGGGILLFALTEAQPTLQHDGMGALASSALRSLKQSVYSQVLQSGCPAPGAAGAPLAVQQALWLVAECIASQPESALNEALSGCSLPKVGAACQNADAGTEGNRQRLFSYVTKALTASLPVDKGRGAVMFSLESAKLYLKAQPMDEKTTAYVSLIDDLETTVAGLFDLDWVKAASGGISLLGDLAALDAKVTVPKRFLQIIASIGQYAATYQRGNSNVSREDLMKARKDILEAFIKSQVSRSNRRGAVFSLGGSFGLGGAYRRSFDGETKGAVAPLLLPIGVALQTYRDCSDCFQNGLHLQLSILDLGQYVSFEGGEAKVGTPNPANSVAPSLTLGWWLWKREIPLFIAAHAGMAPFVRNDGNPVWFAGGMVGAYVPFIDFN